MLGFLRLYLKFERVEKLYVSSSRSFQSFYTLESLNKIHVVHCKMVLDIRRCKVGVKS